MQQDLSAILELVEPSIVTISSKSTHSYSVAKDNGLLSIFSNDEEEKTVRYSRVCSGLVYNSDGYIITKSHVAAKKPDMTITLTNGETYKAEFIGRDHGTGITVLRIDSPGLRPPRVNDDSNVTLGSWTAIVGSAIGCAPSISLGIINGVLPNGLMQVSAMFSPGNAGSPVFDTKGNIIGMLIAQIDAVVADRSTALFPETGLVLSMNEIRKVTDDIIDSYENELGWIGIQFSSADTMSESGRLSLFNVVMNSPAQRAGLRKGDILIKYNDVTLNSQHHLGELVRETKPGSLARISYTRDDTRLNVFVRVGSRHSYYSDNSGSMMSKYYQTGKSRSQVPHLQHKMNRLEREVNQLRREINTKKVN